VYKPNLRSTTTLVQEAAYHETSIFLYVLFACIDLCFKLDNFLYNIFSLNEFDFEHPAKVYHKTLDRKMTSNYWESTQRKFWTFTKQELAVERTKIEESERNLVKMYPLPDRRHLSIYFYHRTFRYQHGLRI
jgi:hypothetical protein